MPLSPFKELWHAARRAARLGRDLLVILRRRHC